MKLKNAATFLTGGTPDTGVADFWAEPGTGIPWISISDMSGVSTVVQTKKELTTQGMASRALPIGCPGTVLFAMYASVGAVSILGIRATWNQAILGITAQPNVSDERFIAYWLTSLAADLGAITRTSTQENLNADQVANLPFADLDIRVQRRIADFLDDQVARIDNVIAARELESNLESAAISAEIDDIIWSGHNSVPVKYLVDPITSGPRGWGDYVSDSGRAFFRIGNLANHGIELSQQNLAFVQVTESAETRRATVAAGDVLLGITASIGHVGLVNTNQAGGTFSQHVARLRPHGSTHAEWLAWTLQTIRVRTSLQLDGYGGTKVGLGLEEVANTQVPLVEPIQQAKSAHLVRKLWQSSKGLRHSFATSAIKLTELKRSLITAAVSGEFEVSSADGSRVPV